MTGPVRIALIGCGRIAQSHIEAFAHTEEAVLTAIADPRESACRAAAEAADCRAFVDPRDPALADLADAVLICTPPSHHFEIARHHLLQDRHVYCEKPLTLRSTEAEELVTIAEQRGLVLMMASKFRYVDDIIKARSIVTSGILGEIIHYENTFTGKLRMADRWNSQPAISGGGVLIDNGSHSVDIAQYLLGTIRSVQAYTCSKAQGLPVEDTAQCLFRTESGVLGRIFLSWSVQIDSPHYIQVYGTQGTLLVGWQGSRYRQDGNNDWIPFGTGYSKLQAFQQQLQNFVASAQRRAQPLISAHAALASVRILESAYESVSRRAWIPCGPDLSFTSPARVETPVLQP